MGAGASAMKPNQVKKIITIKELYDLLEKCATEECSNYENVGVGVERKLIPVNTVDDTSTPNTARSDYSVSSTSSVRSNISNTTASTGYEPGDLMLDGQLLREIVFSAECPFYNENNSLTSSAPCEAGTLIRISYSQQNDNYNVQLSKMIQENGAPLNYYRDKYGMFKSQTCGKSSSKNGYCSVDRLPGDMQIFYYADAPEVVPKQLGKPPIPAKTTNPEPTKIDLGIGPNVLERGTPKPVEWVTPTRGGKRTRKSRKSTRKSSTRKRNGRTRSTRRK